MLNIQRIRGRSKSIGAINVARVLPDHQRRTVGPFIFVDHLQPATLNVGQGIDVRPHPHINLATVTYLFEGALRHRDSLGNDLEIHPGAINWMTAGHGIVHSERSPEAERATERRIHGMQIWVALPSESEEIEPSFFHYPAADIPQREQDGLRLVTLIGEAFELSSPVKTYSPTLYLSIESQNPQLLTLPDADELGVFVVKGSVVIADQTFEAGEMAVIDSAQALLIETQIDSHLMVLGGQKLESERHIWWNFVSSSAERITQAKQDWLAGKFAAVPGESEIIPLPADWKSV